MPSRIVHREEGPDGPLVVQQSGTLRELHFDNGITQSCIDLERPERLPLAANRAMLAHLLFGQRPRSVLLAGCGGGAIARWFAARSPDTRGVAVEKNPDVASLARRYFEFPASWRLQQDDVRRHLRRPRQYDFILVDIEERGRTPGWVSDSRFLSDCRQALTPAGVLTLNLVAETPLSLVATLSQVHRVFGQRTLCLSIPDHDNVLLLAFRRRPSLHHLDERARRHGIHWSLELPALLARLRRENPVGSGIF